MIPKGLFSQIGMIIIAVAIILTYVRPVFEEIAAVQDEISAYEQEIGKVVNVNSMLAEHVATLALVSNKEEQALLRYLPDTVDEIAVLRDLAIITYESGALYKDATYAGEEAAEVPQNKSNTPPKRTGPQPRMHGFNLSAEGTYEQIKQLFYLLDKNAYPLVVEEVNLQPLEGSFLSADLHLVTYAFNEEAGGTGDEEMEIIF